MNDQDHSLSLSDPDHSLVLSHLLVNFLKNLVSCQTSFSSNFCTFSNCSAAFARHYQYPILHNREFRSLGNRKNYLKSTTATPQGNDVLLVDIKNWDKHQICIKSKFKNIHCVNLAFYK
jgi:hypothetical protein